MKWYHILGFIWAIPMSAIAWLFMALLFIFRQTENFYINSDLTFLCDLNNSGFFYKKFMKDKWFGFTIGNTAFIVDLDDTEQNMRCCKHEVRHAHQQYKWGVLFFPAYIIESLRIYVFVKEEHSYLDNCFEIDARSAAGQRVNIPRSDWPDGPNDRCIWW